MEFQSSDRVLEFTEDFQVPELTVEFQDSDRVLEFTEDFVNFHSY